MVSLRRQKGLTPCSGSSSGAASLPGICDSGTSLQASTQEKSDNLHLSPSNNVVQAAEHGTCILTVVTKKAIYTMGDGRVVSGLATSKGKIVGGSQCKLQIISGRLLATMADKKSDCLNLIEHVQQKAKGRYNLHAIRKICNKYLRSREERFEGSVNIIGYLNGRPAMYRTDNKKLRRLKVGAIVGDGKGYGWATMYFGIHQTRRVKTAEQFYKLMERSQVFSALIDTSVGGFLRTATVSRKKVKIQKRAHIVQTLGEYLAVYARLPAAMGELLDINAIHIQFDNIYWVETENLDYSLRGELWVRGQLCNRFRRNFNIRTFAVWFPWRIIARAVCFTESWAGLPDYEVLYDGNDPFPKHDVENNVLVTFQRAAAGYLQTLGAMLTWDQDY